MLFCIKGHFFNFTIHIVKILPTIDGDNSEAFDSFFYNRAGDPLVDIALRIVDFISLFISYFVLIISRLKMMILIFHFDASNKILVFSFWNNY